jgi:hypothetical protein
MAIVASPRTGTGNSLRDKVRLAYLVSHPIQYQAPLLRRIVQEPDIDLTVFYGPDFSAGGIKTKDSAWALKWDVPLLDGYRYEFLPALRDNATVNMTTPLNYGILSRLRGGGEEGQESGFDVLWLHGYATANSLHGMLAAKALGIPVLLRTDSSLTDRVRSGTTLAAKRVFFHALKQLVDGVLPVGTLNAEYWSYYLGEDFPS